MERQSVLVWPWHSADLKYNVFLDTLISQAQPLSPKYIYPASCIFDVENPRALDSHVTFDVITQDMSFSMMVIAETGEEGLHDEAPNDESQAKASFMSALHRKRSLLPISANELSFIIIIIGSEIKDGMIKHFENDAMHPVRMIINRDLTTVPVFVVCLDDTSCALGPSLREYALGHRGDYRAQWTYKSISSTPTVQEINSLFHEIAMEAKPLKASMQSAASSAANGPLPRKVRRSVCIIS